MDMTDLQADGAQDTEKLQREPMSSKGEPRTAAGREWLAKRHRGEPTSEGGIAFRNANLLAILAIEAEAASASSLSQYGELREALKAAPSLRAILNRLGTFNDVWWDRLADEVSAALTVTPASASLDARDVETLQDLIDGVGVVLAGDEDVEWIKPRRKAAQEALARLTTRAADDD